MALSGTKLINDLEITKSTIRGIKSDGMLCAEDEMGIGSDHEGIYVFPKNIKVGMRVDKALGLDDSILEIENKSITHRADLFNHIGFAREMAVLGVGNFDESLFDKQKKLNLKTNINLDIKVKDNISCSRYMAIVMDNIKIEPSPRWMQEKLMCLGLKPINNVVDITNYILNEIGQPLHAFDFDRISGNKILIRPAVNKEKLLLLDGQEYSLNKNDLIISDKNRPIALAGIMGGEFSGINNNTTTIVIESANFNGPMIRRSSRISGIRTDSSIRFEKGLPINFPAIGLLRAVELIKQLAQGRVISKIYDIQSETASKKIKKPVNIKFNFDEAAKFIGSKINKQAVILILKKLGCKIILNQKQSITIIPPIHRPDLNIFPDIIEEIIRVQGTTNIVPKPIKTELKPVLLSDDFFLDDKLKNILVGIGFDEVYNYSFYGDSGLNNFIVGNLYHKKIKNPLNPEQKYLRVSLIPGLLKNAVNNSKYFSKFKIFETGKVFLKKEEKNIAGLIFGKYKNIYLEIKGVVELFLDKIRISKNNLEYKTKSNNIVEIFYKKKKIGVIVTIDKQTAVFECNINFLDNLRDKQGFYKPISLFPSIKRDMAFLIEKKNKWKDIFDTVNNIDPLIKSVDLFDVFEDKKFKNKQSIAFRLIFQSNKKTIESEEVDRIQSVITTRLAKKFKAKLRDF